jgi:hypothetical protein
VELVYKDIRTIQQRTLGPDYPYTAISTYNLGCLAAVQGHTEQALSLLREAMDHGLRSAVAVTMDKDDDLKSLHDDPRFLVLIGHAKELAAAEK